MDTHKYIVKKDNAWIDGLELVPDAGETYSEAFKSSNRKMVEVSNLSAVCGTEDGIDVVRGGPITFREPLLKVSSMPTRTFITIKGGAKASVHNPRFVGKTRFLWQMSVGDFTIYENWPKDLRPDDTHVRIEGAEWVLPNGKRKRPRVLVMKGKVTHDNSVKIFKIPSFIVKLIFAFNRKFGDKRVPALDA